MVLLTADLIESHFVYAICLQSWSSQWHQRYGTSYIAIRRHVNILLNRICIFWSLRSPYLIFLIADSDATSVSHPCWRKILLLFELMYEVLFSFTKASYFALFLHNVEKRFFTALSVLHTKQWKHCNKNDCCIKDSILYFDEEKNEILITCLKPPLLFLSTCYQIFFEPTEIIIIVRN